MIFDLVPGRSIYEIQSFSDPSGQAFFFKKNKKHQTHNSAKVETTKSWVLRRWHGTEQ